MIWSAGHDRRRAGQPRADTGGIIMTTILYHGFRIMFAAIILALSGCAILFFLMWVLVMFVDRGAYLPH
jgi:hypothetical protein